MGKKSGFLTATTPNKHGNARIHYQCKSCLSFLASTSKWDRHLATCFSKTSVGRPVGFRMVTFTTPTLRLKRVRVEDKLRDAGATAESELLPVPGSNSDLTSLTLPTTKPGGSGKTSSFSCIPNFRNEPIRDYNSGNGGEQPIVPKLEMPRKDFHNESTDKKQKTDAEVVTESLLADGEKRLRRSRVEWSQSPQFQSLEFPVIPVSKRKIWTSKLKKTRRRPNNISSLNSIPNTSISNPLTENTEKMFTKSASEVSSTKLRITSVQSDAAKVRSFKYACPKCPAKFDFQGFYQNHVNNIHNGKRRLITCCVCGRIFNKRDSLNNHYFAHEAAEAKEEKFSLFQPWTDECLEKVKLYKSHSSASNFNRQQCCKICFLTHYTHQSYLTHFRQEHADPPESYRVTCKFDKCTEEFSSIRVYIDHAKANHPKQFFGTPLRQQEVIFVGNRRVPKDKDGKLLYKQRVWPSKPPKTNSELCRKIVEKPCNTFATKEEEGGWQEENDVSFENTTVMDGDNEGEEIHQEIPSERKIELERVHLDEDFVVRQEVEWKVVKVEVDEVVDDIEPNPEVTATSKIAERRGRRPRKNDSLNYIKDKKLRKKEQNKSAATRYRQKKKEKRFDIFANEEELQTINEELEKEKDKVGAELRIIRNLLRDMLQAKKKWNVRTSPSLASSRLTASSIVQAQRIANRRK